MAAIGLWLQRGKAKLREMCPLLLREQGDAVKDQAVDQFRPSRGQAGRNRGSGVVAENARLVPAHGSHHGRYGFAITRDADRCCWSVGLPEARGIHRHRAEAAIGQQGQDRAELIAAEGRLVEQDQRGAITRDPQVDLPVGAIDIGPAQGHLREGTPSSIQARMIAVNRFGVSIGGKWPTSGR